MSRLKSGNRVSDGAGSFGRVIEVRHIPSPGQGIAAHDEIYVDWYSPVTELVISKEASPEED